MAGRRGDEEAPILDQATQSQEGEKKPKVPKPAWLDQNDQYSMTNFTVAAAVLLQPLSGHELDIHFTRLLMSLLFLHYLSTGALMLCIFFSNAKPSSTLKMIIVLLNLLVVAMLMAANAAFLTLVDKSFLPLVSIPILGFVLVAIAILFNSKLEPDEVVVDEDNEAMVKKCFKIANNATITGFGVQIAVVRYCLKNHVSLKNHHQYSIMAAFVTSTLGVFSSTITSSPLQFQSDVVCRLLKQMPIILLFLQGLVAVFVSAKFLDPVKEVFAVCIPSVVLFIVNLCQKPSKAVEEDSNSMYGALANFSIVPILAIYEVKLESGECTTYLSYSVFFLLLAILTSLMRTAFSFSRACTALEHVTNALPMVRSCGRSCAASDRVLHVCGFKWSSSTTLSFPSLNKVNMH